jgi:hypothetical protein
MPVADLLMVGFLMLVAFGGLWLIIVLSKDEINK